MERKKVIIGFFIAIILAVVAVLPFFGGGFIPTHDGEYHIIRFMEFYKMLSQGYLLPRWAPTLNGGYGIPIFEFLYPFVYYVGSVIHFFGVGFVDTFKIGSALGYLTAVLFCFLWLRKRFGWFAATSGTIASSFVPYWFVELYVRGEIVEVWAIAAIFASLFFIEQGWPLAFTVSIGILILAHNILAMIFFPAIILYALWRKSWKWLPLILVGMGLSAWFWIPALMESKYMVGLNIVNFHDYFVSLADLLIPSWGTGFALSGQSGNTVSFQIGIAPLLWILTALFLLTFSKLKKAVRLELSGVVFVNVLAILMTLPLSVVLWNRLPLLSFVQYPWRFLAYLIPATAYIAAMVSFSIKKQWFVFGLAVLSVLLSFGYTRGAIYQSRNDQYYESRTNFTGGTSSMGNSLSTIWTPWKSQKPAAIVTDTKGNPLQSITLTDKYLDKKFRIMLPMAQTIRVNILYFPGWVAQIDGKGVPIDYRTNGTLDIHVPVGRHSVEVFMTETPVRRVADEISIVSLVVMVLWGILLYTKKVNI